MQRWYVLIGNTMDNFAIEQEKAKITRIMWPYKPVIVAEAIEDDSFGIIYSVSATTINLRIIGCGLTLQEAFDDLLMGIRAEA